MIVAIDGPAASGKGTLAKLIARHYGLPHLDTGLLYRAVAQGVLAQDADLADEAAAARIAGQVEVSSLDDPQLREPGIGRAASRIASHGQVRQALLAYQRNFARGHAGAVLDGRDIGTVICPDADVKLFVSASADVRALRRFKELKARGVAISQAEVLADIHARDEQDSTRSAAPLCQAEDAALLDTSNLDIDAAFKAAIDLIEAERSRAGRAD